jgi:hypothetical protein
MPTPLTPPPLEVVLQGLHDSEIRCGIQNEPPAGGITAWIDYGDRTEKATFYGTVVGDRQVCRLRIVSRRGCTRPRCASFLIAPMPKSTAPKRRRSPPKISAVEKTAVRIMRKLHEATGGR